MRILGVSEDHADKVFDHYAKDGWISFRDIEDAASDAYHEPSDNTEDSYAAHDD